MPGYSVRIEGLSEAAKIPGWLDRAQRELVGRLSDRVAEAIGEKAPGGRGGSVGRTWQGRALSSTAALVSSDHPGAKALARGAYHTPKRAKALRFRSGAYRAWARLPATNYDKQGLRRRNRIAREEFECAFGNLGG